MSAQFVRFSEVYKASDGWRFRLRAGNGEVVAEGEAYEHRADAVDAAMSLAPDVEVKEVEG